MVRLPRHGSEAPASTGPARARAGAPSARQEHSSLRTKSRGVRPAIHPGLTAGNETRVAFGRRSIPAEPRRFAPLIVALRSKYTRYSSLARLVSRAPRRPRRSRGFHHRLFTAPLRVAHRCASVEIHQVFLPCAPCQPDPHRENWASPTSALTSLRPQAARSLRTKSRGVRPAIHPGQTTGGETHVAFGRRSIPAEPRRFAPLIVALRSKYTRYSSLARLVSRTPTGRTGPRRPRRSRHFVHRPLAA